ncbi:right-handed parallel beta-helix repeat-containing protein [Seonamhaeicola maritimus]|uniref:Right handed beta helix domain-containing protein n=1 Tax=Seonamhaeicola maritimus TaxID=2591822 RepID=A0A5C7GL77_9FLAO|nr:right-handed parallel beta-helix repeat-containing protein [Seonamhaeicola maritimus]TXG39052.1 hypothetical protein FUA22_03995 [Seonamhaeicola maritimus]
MSQVRSALIILCICFFSDLFAKQIRISSLEELSEYAEKSGNSITLAPGIYKLAEFLTVDSLEARRNRKMYQFITFSGDNNTFNFKGVKILVDTELRTILKPKIHSTEFLISGSGNTISGLKLEYIGKGTSPGGVALEVAGNNNIVRGVTIHVTGSYPYGYGDLFGKGRESVIRHKKHSGFLVTGSNTKILGCKLYMKSFGHGFFIQKNAENIYFEDCYVEGEVRKTDEILGETSGPAFDVNFKTWTENRSGEYKVTPGYVKSLCEDGFRTYGRIKNIQFKNCTAKNTRAGFELRAASNVNLENCKAIGTERGFWVGDNAILENCKGDAAHGPLFYIEGSSVKAQFTLMSTTANVMVHVLGTIQESNNEVVIKTEKEGTIRPSKVPILIGFSPPRHGESMSPIADFETSGLKLTNETRMPLIIGGQAKDCELKTFGSVIENKGTKVNIINL